MGFWSRNIQIENQLVKCISDHLGDHIRIRRKALNLQQKDVAKLFGVCEDTITGWENRRSKPLFCHYPKIKQFLGYAPTCINGNTLGDKIRRFRMEFGLSQEKLAVMVDVDETTIRSWEMDTHKPFGRKLLKLQGMGIS